MFLGGGRCGRGEHRVGGLERLGAADRNGSGRDGEAVESIVIVDVAAVREDW